MAISYLPKTALNKTISKSLTLKLIAIAALVLIFLIPVSLVKGLVSERQFRQDNVAREVASSWGGVQTIAGPVLAVPYSVTVKDQSQTRDVIEHAYFLPETFGVLGNVDVEIRSRGIYDVPLYTTKLTAKGIFNAPEIASLGLAPTQMRWGEAFLVLGIPDLRGVKEQIKLEWPGSNGIFRPGVTTAVVSSGVRAPVTLGLNEQGVPQPGRSYSYSITADLRGSEQLMFVPAAKTTDVKLTSVWPNPSFVGAFLPSERTVGDTGFTASWRVLDVNRNLPEKWTGNKAMLQFAFADGMVKPAAEPYRGGYYPDQPTVADGNSGVFGVRMFLPVDVYQKTMRSAKYGIAVIALVFVVVFFVELSAKRRVHPVQYVLIGLALVIYYTLLLSLSEHLRFLYAYLISSLAIIGMVTLFIKSVLESSTRAIMTGGILTVFYLFVYVLLQLEDYALLLGSIALFLILAVIMMLSRRINWYGEETAA